MRKLCLLGGVIASALLIGCKDTVDESIFLVDASQAVEADLTDVATDFRIIRLKSDEPIDGISRYFFFDKWILGLSEFEGRWYPRVSLFDKDGNLVSVLYVDAYMDASMAILKYSVPDFSYLGKVDFGEGYEIRDIGPLDSGKFLVLLNHGGDGKGYYSGVARTVLFDVNNLSDTVVIYTDSWNHHNNLFENFAYGINRHNPLLKTIGYVNTIYRIQDNRLTPALRFKFGDNGVPQKIFDDFEKDPDHERNVSAIDGGVMDYVLNNDGCHLPYIFDAAQNGELISFMYLAYDESKGFGFNSFFYVNDGHKSASYSKLRIPGLNETATISAIDKTKYVWEIPATGNLVDESVPMSGLAREILDSLAIQNDDNPVLLEYRFTF